MSCSNDKEKTTEFGCFSEEDWYGKLGNNVKLRRIELNLTQKELAIKAKVDPNVISRIERGIALPDCFEFAAVAIALGVRVEDLLPSR